MARVPTERPSASSSHSNSSDGVRWFAYIDERHEGPFSTGDVHAKLVDESLRPDDYVWKAGMADWQPLSEMELFYPDAPVPIETPAPSIEPTKTYASPRVSPPANSVFQPNLSVDRFPEAPRRFRARRALTIGILAVLATLSGFLMSGEQESKRLTAIGDISANDSRRLAEVIRLSPKKATTAAIAVAVGNSASPVFYIGTNAKDGTIIQIRLEGTSGSVLARNPPRMAQNLTIRDHIGQSLPFARENGRSLPRGEYRIRALDSLGTILSEEVLYLGGTPDEGFRRELASIQANLPRQRRAELTELRQIGAALEDQLLQTTNAFSTSAEWGNFSRGWTTFQKQLTSELRSTPTDEDDIAYLSFFSRARGILSRITAIHSNQSLAIRDRKRRSDLEVEIAESTSIARSEILALQSDVSLAEKKLHISPRK